MGQVDYKTLRRRGPRALWVAYLLCIFMVAAMAPAGATPDTSTLLYPLPADRTPNDGIENDDGWLLVDFCTAGATGAGPAAPPDCHHNDDDSALNALPFTFTFYGDPFGDVFVNNNGNLSFGTLFSTFTATGFPVTGFPMVAPFWADVDTGDQGDPADKPGHVWFKEFDGNTFVVTWDDVGYFNENDDLKNTFQVAISDGTNPIMGVGNNVCFSYGDMQWTTGDASGGVGGFGGVPATVGVNRGDGTDFAQIGRFDHAGTDYDGPSGSADGVSYLDGKQFCFNATGENVPPIAQGFPTAPVMINVGTTFNLSAAFSSPESDQTTTIAIQDPDGAQSAGLNIINTPGNLATLDMSWTPDTADVGVYVLTFVASDNFDPPGQTTQSLTFEVVGATATINVIKNVDSEPDGVFDDDASGWTYEVSQTGVGLIGSDLTTASGELSFEVDPGEDYSVQETDGPTSLWLVSWSCVDDETGAPIGSGGGLFPPNQGPTNLDLVVDQSITCTFDNQLMAGFLTGGGQTVDDDEGALKRNSVERISFGGNVGVALDGSLHGQWQANFHNVSDDSLDGGKFHTTSIDRVIFSDISSLEEPDPPEAAFNFIEFNATGRWNGADGWSVTVRATDTGEPASGNNSGADTDSIHIQLFDPSGALVYDSGSNFPDEQDGRHELDHGNLQIHPAE